MAPQLFARYKCLYNIGQPSTPASQETSLPDVPGNLIPLAPVGDGEWIGLYYSSRQPVDVVRFSLVASGQADLSTVGVSKKDVVFVPGAVNTLLVWLMTNSITAFFLKKVTDIFRSKILDKGSK